MALRDSPRPDWALFSTDTRGLQRGGGANGIPLFAPISEACVYTSGTTCVRRKAAAENHENDSVGTGEVFELELQHEERN